MLEGHLPRVIHHQVNNVYEGNFMSMVIYCMLTAIYYTLMALYYTITSIYTKVTTAYYKIGAPSCFSTAAQKRSPPRQIARVGRLKAKVESLSTVGKVDSLLTLCGDSHLELDLTRGLLARGTFLQEGLMVQGLGFGVWGVGFGVWGLGFGVWGLGFGVWGLEFGV